MKRKLFPLTLVAVIALSGCFMKNRPAEKVPGPAPGSGVATTREDLERRGFLCAGK